MPEKLPLTPANYREPPVLDFEVLDTIEDHRAYHTELQERVQLVKAGRLHLAELDAKAWAAIVTAVSHLQEHYTHQVEQLATTALEELSRPVTRTQADPKVLTRVRRQLDLVTAKSPSSERDADQQVAKAVASVPRRHLAAGLETIHTLDELKGALDQRIAQEVQQ